MQKELYTLKESCQVLNIGLTSLYKHINAGRIKAVKLSNKTLITRNALDEFISGLGAYPVKTQECNNG